MIKQDYLVRMIQEIITLIIQALLNRRKIKKESWVEYDDLTRQILGVPSEKLPEISPDEILSRYEGDPFRMGKIELAAVTLLKVADESDIRLVNRSKLQQDALALLRYVQQNSTEFSLQRIQIINLLEQNCR